MLANVIFATVVPCPDILQDDSLHGKVVAPLQDTQGPFGIDNVNVTQGNVAISGVGHHVTGGTGNVRPAETAGSRVARIGRVSAVLLCRAQPNGVLQRFNHGNVFVQDILNEAVWVTVSRVGWCSKLGVNTLVGPVEDGITKGDILDGGSRDGTDRQAQTGSCNSFKEHVGR